MEETKSGLTCPLRAPAVALLPELIPGVLTWLLPPGGRGWFCNVSAPAGVPCVCFLSWLPCFLSQNGRIRIFSTLRKILD